MFFNSKEERRLKEKILKINLIDSKISDQPDPLNDRLYFGGAFKLYQLARVSLQPPVFGDGCVLTGREERVVLWACHGICI